MPIEAAVTLLIILGVVWGGFTTLLVLALRKERRKRSQGHDA